VRIITLVLLICAAAGASASPATNPSPQFPIACNGTVNKSVTGDYFLVRPADQYGDVCGGPEIRQKDISKVLAACPQMTDCSSSGAMINFSHGVFEWIRIDSAQRVPEDQLPGAHGGCDASGCSPSPSGEPDKRQATAESPNSNLDLPRHFSLKLSWHGTEDYPVIDGISDIPDGATIMIMVLRPMLPDAAERIARGIPGCVGGVCDPAILKDGTGADYMLSAKIKYGHFSIGPLSLGHAPFYPGVYSIQVYLPVGRLPSATTPAEAAARWADSLSTPIYRANLTLR